MNDERPKEDESRTGLPGGIDPDRDGSRVENPRPEEEIAPGRGDIPNLPGGDHPGADIPATPNPDIGTPGGGGADVVAPGGGEGGIPGQPH
ncbi:MAG TPA: hypothetical protein VEX38_08630 [Fimbriimonadaceae bacterium]|nr:hypothetical protein [Fimbriimonadaceae bacterium]